MTGPASARINPKLYVAARLVEGLVPDYDIKQSDPLIAAQEGRGNCVAKAVIAGVMLDKAQFVGAKPALAWNRNTHPKIDEDLFGKTKKLNGHAYLLTTSNGRPTRIAGISFNPYATISQDWDIFPFNDEDTIYAQAENGIIQATDAGLALGFIINNLHEGGKSYMEALGDKNSVYHRMEELEMYDAIVDKLAVRGLLTRLSEER